MHGKDIQIKNEYLQHLDYPRKCQSGVSTKLWRFFAFLEDSISTSTEKDIEHPKDHGYQIFQICEALSWNKTSGGYIFSKCGACGYVSHN